MAIFQPMEGAVEPGRRACFWSPSFQFQTLMKIPDHWRDPGIFGGSVTLMLLSLRFMHFFDNMVHYPWDAWEVQAFSTRKTYHVENKHPFYPEVVEVYIYMHILKFLKFLSEGSFGSQRIHSNLPFHNVQLLKRIGGIDLGQQFTRQQAKRLHE